MKKMVELKEKKAKWCFLNIYKSYGLSMLFIFNQICVIVKYFFQDLSYQCLGQTISQ